MFLSFSLSKQFLKDFIYLFLERGEGREKERERNINQLPLTCPQLGTWPASHVCALTGYWTGDLSLCRPVFNPLSHTSQGSKQFFFNLKENKAAGKIPWQFFLLVLLLQCEQFFSRHDCSDITTSQLGNTKPGWISSEHVNKAFCKYRRRNIMVVQSMSLEMFGE